MRLSRRGVRVAAVAFAAILTLSSAVYSLPSSVMSAQTTPVQNQIWFAPLPPDITNGESYTGSVDFMDLFTPDAPWMNTSKHVSVFELYGGWVARGANTTTLRQVVTDLNRRGMLIAFEANPIELTSDCQNGLSAWTSEGLQIANNIKIAGGNVSYVAMDSPFGRANIDSACHWSAEKIAETVSVYIQAIKTVFPNAVIGDTEPLWDGVVTPYKDWMTAFKSVTGSNLPFFHLDTEWTLPNWPQEALELEAFAHSNGIKFGMLYEDNTNNYSNQEWINLAETRMVTYEAKYGGRPDHTLFQSWVDKPDHVLPETSANTFTYLILRYVRTRTTLTYTISPASTDGFRSLNGALRNLDGTPLASTPVSLFEKPITGPGIFTEYTAFGTVPAQSETADAGFRVNIECGCTGTSDFVLYWVRYTEAPSATNPVPNWNFSSGLNGWGHWGDGSANLESSDMDTGMMLHITVTNIQTLGMNSADFPVTPGANYTVTFGARISPASTGSGYLSLVFLNQTELMRQRIYLEPQRILLRTATTDSSGAFTFPLQGLSLDTLLLEVEYPGDVSHWPAYGQSPSTSLTTLTIPMLFATLFTSSAIIVIAHRLSKRKESET